MQKSSWIFFYFWNDLKTEIIVQIIGDPEKHPKSAKFWKDFSKANKMVGSKMKIYELWF